MNRSKVILCSNSAWNVFNFRRGLISALMKAGHEVVVVAPADVYADRVTELGCRLIPLEMNSNSISPFKDLLLIYRFYKIFRNEAPSHYLGFTIKPNIYGSVAASFFNIRVINNIAGLGATFANQNWLTFIVKWLYRVALARSSCVFFQNTEDQDFFVRDKIVNPRLAMRLPGSGVDLERFNPSVHHAHPETIRFLLVGRLLWEKGVGDYVEAARLLKKKYPNLEFCILGFLDPKNPNAVSTEQVAAWTAEGLIQYLGTSDDVRKQLASADCVVLPSYYREGVPRTLLEAAAMGKPIVTTDNVGCRDVVTHGLNGLLCEARNPTDLAAKLEQFSKLSAEARTSMGMKGRQKVELEFGESVVIDRYLAALV